MGRYTEGEMTQLSLKTVTIRKSQNCWGCMKEFPPGTEMTKNVCVDQGDFTSSYWCEKCDDFIETLEHWELEDGLGYGELLNFEEYENERIHL